MPDMQEITEQELSTNIAQMLGVEYLEGSVVPMDLFPVKGCLYSNHNLIVASLMCRRSLTKEFIDVIFIVDTGSPTTYLSRHAMAALESPGKPHMNVMHVFVHGRTIIECHRTPRDMHSGVVNVLGMDAIAALDLSIIVDKNRRLVELRQGVQL